MSRTRTAALALLGALLVGTFLPAEDVRAQDDGGTWDVETELGGSVLFGNRNQSQFLAAAELEGDHSRVDTQWGVRFTYGVSTDSEGVTSVNRRSWVVNNSIDLWPEGLVRPYLSGRMERSYERRIAFRHDTGIGVKLDHQVDRNNRIEFSVSVLAERTFRRTEPGEADEENTLARWFSSLRIRRTLSDDRVAVDFQQTYRPTVGDLGAFTYSTRNALTLDMTEVVALRLAFRLDHDSGAVERGADTNRDGQINVSIVAQF